MSIHEKRNVNCPKCQHNQAVAVWSSINVTLNPEARSRLFDGEINHFKCIKCGYEALVPTPLLYHDPERKIAVHYFPAESMRKAEFLDQFDLQGKFQVTDEVDFEVPDHLLDIHVVFNMNELVSYVIFREMLIEFHQGNIEETDPSLN